MMQLSAPADQLVSIDIVLGRSNGVYRPGDHVTGHVIIDAKQDIPLCGTPSRERVYLPQNRKKTYKIIVSITIVAGYQIGKPIKLVAYSTNYINS